MADWTGVTTFTLPAAHWPLLVAILCLDAIYETVTDAVDNLVLPAFTYALLLLLDKPAE